MSEIDPKHLREVVRKEDDSWWFTLQVNAWPLKNVGDEMFFGYIIGLVLTGVEYIEDTLGNALSFAVFSYGGGVTAYALPYDKGLLDELYKYWSWNIHEECEIGSGMIGKVYIKKLETGYEVQLP